MLKSYIAAGEPCRVVLMAVPGSASNASDNKAQYEDRIQKLQREINSLVKTIDK
jgi:hypothetical protein